MPERFQPRHLQRLRRAFADGGMLECPVCSVPLDRRPVNPRPDVSYVRFRVVLACPRCHRWAVLDRSEDR